MAAQRRVNGSARRKTDPIDLLAIGDLLVAGRGYEIAVGAEPLVELASWVAHRRRRVAVRTATKNQLLTQADRCFPGLAGCLWSVLDSKIGRLVLTEFSDPDRLARLGAARFRAFAAKRDVRVSITVAERLVAAARNALPTPEAATARQVVAADLALLTDLDAQIAAAQARIAALVPATVYGVLTTTPGWGTLRAGTYAAAVGDPTHAGLPTPRSTGRRG